MKEAIAKIDLSLPARELFQKWVENWHDHEICDEIYFKLHELLPQEAEKDHYLLERIMKNDRMLTVQTIWAIGGDGWAYDIGFGGVDHVLASGKNINIMVLDTEMYSNTGGQVSKATPQAISIKYILGGKSQEKKNLGKIAMHYGNCYVAQICMGADYTQAVKAIHEAESFPGPSLILCYAPCVDWGYEVKDLNSIQKIATECGMWPIYRFDPRKGDRAFQLDSKKIKSDVKDYMKGQNRFNKLFRENPKRAEDLQIQLATYVKNTHNNYLRLSMGDLDLLEFLKKKHGEEVSSEKHTILFGSETGNALLAADMLYYELRRRGVRTQVVAMDDYDFEDLSNEHMVHAIISTCGQGEYPGNSQQFMHNLTTADKNLKGVKFSVFGLGDTSYVHFNKAANDVQEHLLRMGAEELIGIGLGDDKDDDGWETEFNTWTPEVFIEAELPPPPDSLSPPTFSFNIKKGKQPAHDIFIPQGTQLVPLTKSELTSDPRNEGYDRDIRHYELDISQTGWQYSCGDCLAIYPSSQEQDTLNFLDKMRLNPDDVVQIDKIDGGRNPYGQKLTNKQLFGSVLDIFGKPNRRFYEFAGISATNSNEKAKLRRLLTKEGADGLKKLTAETATYADLIYKFPSIGITPERLIEFVPAIKPRLYSIASAQEMKQDSIELCIIAEDWEGRDFQSHPGAVKDRHGLTTFDLRYKTPYSDDGYVIASLCAGGINVPEHHEDPFVMVGLGTGIAPLRAMIQERQIFKDRGEKTGPMSLFYGFRNSSNEYTYEDELLQYHDGGKGVLTNMHTAPSRDQAHKVYVQHKMDENLDEIYESIYKKNGYFYLCGPAGRIPAEARKSIISAFVKHGHTETAADEYLTQMQIDGRYNLDVW